MRIAFQPRFGLLSVTDAQFHSGKKEAQVTLQVPDADGNDVALLQAIEPQFDPNQSGLDTFTIGVHQSDSGFYTHLGSVSSGSNSTSSLTRNDATKDTVQPLVDALLTRASSGPVNTGLEIDGVVRDEFM